MLPIFLLFMSLAQAAVEPFASYPKLVSANGRGVLVFNGANEGGSVIDQFSDRIYKQVDPDSDEVRDLLYDTYFAVDGQWLRSATHTQYVEATGIVHIERPFDGLGIVEYAWAPMGLAWPGMAQVLAVTNTGDSSRTLTVNSLHNYHVGSDNAGANNGNEAIWVQDGSIIEKGNLTGLGMRFDTTTPSANFTCDQAFNNVGNFDGRCGTATEPWSLSVMKKWLRHAAYAVTRRRAN